MRSAWRSSLRRSLGRAPSRMRDFALGPSTILATTVRLSRTRSSRSSHSSFLTRALSASFDLRNPFRLVLDLQGRRPDSDMRPPGLVERDDSKTIVVLDPGHGGVEMGAVGPSGLKEKDVALDLAGGCLALALAIAYTRVMDDRRRPRKGA